MTYIAVENENEIINENTKKKGKINQENREKKTSRHKETRKTIEQRQRKEEEASTTYVEGNKREDTAILPARLKQHAVLAATNTASFATTAAAVARPGRLPNPSPPPFIPQNARGTESYRTAPHHLLH